MKIFKPDGTWLLSRAHAPVGLATFTSSASQPDVVFFLSRDDSQKKALTPAAASAIEGNPLE